MNGKPFEIEVFCNGVTLNGASLQGTDMVENTQPDGSEAMVFTIPKALVGTRFRLRESLPTVQAPPPRVPGVRFVEPVDMPEAGERMVPEVGEPEPEKAPEALKTPEPVKTPEPAKVPKQATKATKPEKAAKRKVQMGPDLSVEPADVRTAITSLHLTGPTTRRLAENGINTVGQLIKRTPAQLYSLDLSVNTVGLIRNALYKIGHDLTITDPKITDIVKAPMTLLKLKEAGVTTVEQLLDNTRAELSIVPGCNDHQLDLIEERLRRYLGKSLKPEKGD